MDGPIVVLQRQQNLRCRCGLAGALIAFSAAAPAADVLVFTDSRHPVQHAEGARVIELDAPQRIEIDLAAGLPSEPSQAEAVAQQRLSAGGQALQRQMQLAYQGVLDAWSLGVAKLPAVVVDQRYVVYGDPDVGRALARIDAARAGEQP